MASITYPTPLRAGGRIEVPAPSMGVPGDLHERLRAGVEALTARGFEVHVRPHARTAGLTPAPAAARAEDLHAAFAAADVVLPRGVGNSRSSCSSGSTGTRSPRPDRGSWGGRTSRRSCCR